MENELRTADNEAEQLSDIECIKYEMSAADKQYLIDHADADWDREGFYKLSPEDQEFVLQSSWEVQQIAKRLGIV